MQEKYLQAGQIVNTHGVRGEVRVLPWADSPSFLCRFSTVYIDGAPVPVRRARVHKNTAIFSLAGVDSMESAAALKGKILCIDRADAPLPPDRFFVQDALGLTAVENETGRSLGTVTDVLDLPAGCVLEIGGKNGWLVPAVPEFIREFNPDEGIVRIHIIEGMEP